PCLFLYPLPPPPPSTLFPYTTLFRSPRLPRPHDIRLDLVPYHNGVPLVAVCLSQGYLEHQRRRLPDYCGSPPRGVFEGLDYRPEDRKSTRLNSSHGSISYAVFCLKKK